MDLIPLTNYFFILVRYLKMQKEENSDQLSVTTLLQKQQKSWWLVVFVGLLLLVSVTLVMSKCDKPNQEHGGKTMPIDPSQIIQPTITPNQTQGLSLKNGLPSMSRSQENVGSTLRSMQENKSNDSTTENLEMTSGRIRVLKSF